MAVRIIVGDAEEQLAKLPDASVHCVVTSPPYWGLRAYGGGKKEMGSEPTYDEHIKKLVEVFREVKRVLRPDGTLWLNYGDVYASSVNGRKAEDIKKLGKDDRTFRNKPVNTVTGDLKPKDLAMMPARVALALQKDGWYLRSDIIWVKPNPMPESIEDRPTSTYEHMFLFARSEHYYFDAQAVREPVKWGHDPRADRGRISYVSGKRPKQDGPMQQSFVQIDTAGRNIRNVWTIAAQGFDGAHFATFPTALVEPCLKAGASLHGCCAVCGAPYVRIVKPSDRYAAHLGQSWHDHKADKTMGQKQQRGQNRANLPRDKSGITSKETVTVGWSRSCKCKGHPTPSKSVVLDPFGGAGTVGLVADQLGMSALLIELNPDYAALAQKRIIKERGLFASVKLERTK